MLRTVIIDDENHIRDTLINMLETNCPDMVRVIGQALGVESGLEAIRSLQPVLVFLDIQMKDGTGFDLIRAFPEIYFKVIFISAFDKKMIRVLKQRGLAYLMKPFNPEEITAAINRVINR